MTDIFSREKRSDVMSRIKGKNTSVELVVFRYLRRNGVYFQKHYRRAPGSPDIALPRKKRAVFIHGDFWHGRTLDKLVQRRGENDFWTKKIRRNIERDNQAELALKASGWKLMTVWESDLKRKSSNEETSGPWKSF